MSFFPAVDPRHGDPEDLDDVLVLEPAWAGHPVDELPGTLPIVVELGRSASTAVHLEDVRAYSEGVVFRIAVRIRRTTVRERSRVLGQLDITHGRGSFHLALPAGGLRWGFEYADGRRVTTLDSSPWSAVPADADPVDWTPTEPIMDGASQPMHYAERWARDVWLWPLPPEGDLRAVCAWPDRGVAETSSILDATSIRAAAARARPLWP
ncbi:hypothetical protein [Cellulomonas sp. URHE0023]|uniref:hypothetical protein n=1 Tax=Cellulomonas sp. URHE0023 TaxID=1380354 RepID=UPI000482A57D|nr:hypothetical protein [Cellulomonas sp. URHE0023]